MHNIFTKLLFTDKFVWNSINAEEEEEEGKKSKIFVFTAVQSRD